MRGTSFQLCSSNTYITSLPSLQFAVAEWGQTEDTNHVTRVGKVGTQKRMEYVHWFFLFLQPQASRSNGRQTEGSSCFYVTAAAFHGMQWFCEATSGSSNLKPLRLRWWKPRNAAAVTSKQPLPSVGRPFNLLPRE